MIRNDENGYVCRTPEEYAERIQETMEKFPFDIAEKAYQDVFSTYNTEVMRRRYISLYKSVWGIYELIDYYANNEAVAV